MQTTKKETLDRLRKEIWGLQERPTPPEMDDTTPFLGPLQEAFPERRFPLGAVHELLSNNMECAAATSGFMAALISFLMKNDKSCLWVSTQRTIFPPALKQLGILPDRLIFIDAVREKEALWTVEEALKCEAFAAVIGEIRNIDFKQSRRLQLAVESSRVTGFIHHLLPQQIRPTACVSRWRIQPVASRLQTGIPGVGHPRWQVELLKIRNGTPGSWQLEWAKGKFSAAQDTLLQKAPSLSKIGVA